MSELTPNQQKQKDIIVGFYEARDLLYFLYNGRDARKDIVIQPAKSRRKYQRKVNRVRSKIPSEESLEGQIKVFQQAETDMKEKGEWTPCSFTTLPPSSEEGSLLNLRKMLNQMKDE